MNYLIVNKTDIHVLYMCVRGYQFYLLLEKSCTAYVCEGISVLFTIGKVMYCLCVLGDISFIYYIQYMTSLIVNKMKSPKTQIPYMTSPIVNKTDIL
jgi:hypothetical protein